MHHRSVEHRRAARREINDLISAAAIRIQNRKALHAYWNLIALVQSRSGLLRPFAGCRHSAHAVVEQTLRGLVNLSLSHKIWARELWDWQPLGDTHRAVFSSLVRFLIDHHEVPEFMISAWLEEPGGSASATQKWYVHFARSGTIRGLGVAAHLDRQQAACFCDAPHHFELTEALAWGQQRRVSENKQKARRQMISRRRRKSLTGWLNRWRRDEWKALGVRSLSVNSEQVSLDGPRSWTIRELLTHRELVEEGAQMDHCVGAYVHRCKAGLSSIWSMKQHTPERSDRLITIEVDPQRNTIVTALGYGNCRPDQEARHIMETWARTAGLQIASRV